MLERLSKVSQARVAGPLDDRQLNFQLYLLFKISIPSASISIAILTVFNESIAKDIMYSKYAQSPTPSAKNRTIIELIKPSRGSVRIFSTYGVELDFSRNDVLSFSSRKVVKTVTPLTGLSRMYEYSFTQLRMVSTMMETWARRRWYPKQWHLYEDLRMRQVRLDDIL